MRYFSISLCIIIVLCIGCGGRKTPTTDALFSKYIKEKFSMSIPEEPHYFILVSHLGCKGCMERDLDKLTKYMEGKPKNQYTLITSFPDIIPGNLKNSITYLVDSNAKMDYLNLEISNVTVFKTGNGKIDKRHSFALNDTASFCNIMDKL